MVPAALLLMLVVVALAAALPATGAQARLHPSRPCQRTKQCSGVTAADAPKTENKGMCSGTYSEAVQESTSSGIHLSHVVM